MDLESQDILHTWTCSNKLCELRILILHDNMHALRLFFKSPLNFYIAWILNIRLEYFPHNRRNRARGIVSCFASVYLINMHVAALQIMISKCDHKVEKCVDRLQQQAMQTILLRVIYVDNTYNSRGFSSFLLFF